MLKHLPDGKAGQVIWSPDGREVALTIADDDGSGSVCLPAQAITHTILVIEAETLDVKLALRQDPRQLNTQSWSQLGLIKLIDGAAKPFLLDPLTGEVWDALAERPVGTPNAPIQIRPGRRLGGSRQSSALCRPPGAAPATPPARR